MEDHRRVKIKYTRSGSSGLVEDDGIPQHTIDSLFTPIVNTARKANRSSIARDTFVFEFRDHGHLIIDELLKVVSDFEDDVRRIIRRLLEKEEPEEVQLKLLEVDDNIAMSQDIPETGITSKPLTISRK